MTVQREDPASSVNSPEDIRAMEVSLSEIAAIYKHGFTKFETMLWSNIMRITPRRKFEGFLQVYVLSPDAQYGAPKPHHAAKFLGMVLDVDSAYVQLEEAVRRFGPYQTPAISDPVLIAAVHNMGGWARVNELMPDSKSAFDVKEFKARFQGALNQAVNQVRIDGATPDPLLALQKAAPPILEESAPRRLLPANRV